MRIEDDKASARANILKAQVKDQKTLPLAGLSKDDQMFGAFRMRQEISGLAWFRIYDNIAQGQTASELALKQPRNSVPGVGDDLFGEEHRAL